MGNVAVIAIVGIGLLLMVGATSKAAAAAQGGFLSFDNLADQYGSQTTSILVSIYNELIIRGYTETQILFMLSQILFESGLFTDVANWRLIQQNNFAGLTRVSGGYAAYNTISDFVDAYDGFLTKGADPLAASNLSDFNSRLVANHYYTENPAVYYNGLLHNYNVLTSNMIE